MKGVVSCMFSKHDGVQNSIEAVVMLILKALWIFFHLPMKIILSSRVIHLMLFHGWHPKIQGGEIQFHFKEIRI